MPKLTATKSAETGSIAVVSLIAGICTGREPFWGGQFRRDRLSDERRREPLKIACDGELDKLFSKFASAKALSWRSFTMLQRYCGLTVSAWLAINLG